MTICRGTVCAFLWLVYKKRRISRHALDGNDTVKNTTGTGKKTGKTAS
jgi:hypothetical protein